MVTHTFSHSTWEAEADRFLILMSACSKSKFQDNQRNPVLKKRKENNSPAWSVVAIAAGFCLDGEEERECGTHPPVLCSTQQGTNFHALWRTNL